MSVITTESWMRFDQAAVAGLGSVYDLLLKGDWTGWGRSGGAVFPPNASVGTVVNVGFVQDPVVASRRAVRLETIATGASGSNRGIALGKFFPSPKTHWRCGMRIRGGILAASVSNGRVLVTIGPASINSTATSGAPEPVSTWMNVIQLDFATGSVSVDGVFTSAITGTKVTLPTVAVQNRDYYIEIEIDTVANLVRAWVDDLLLVDTAFPAGVLAAAKAAYDAGVGVMVGATSGANTPGGQCVMRDFYCLEVDATAPFVRLGPTTQVIGERPTDDVQAQFARPSGFTSNAEVVDQGLAANPVDFLVGEDAGTEDRYTVASSSVVTSASLVYAVGIKTQIANYAAGTHIVAAVLNNVDGPLETNLASLPSASGFINREAYFPLAPSGSAWTPQEAADVEFGLKVVS